jgi:hypothetical protein
MKTNGGVKVQLRSLLTSALDRGRSWASRSALFTAAEINNCPLYGRLGGAQSSSASRGGGKLSSGKWTPINRSSSFYPRHCTDSGVPPIRSTAVTTRGSPGFPVRPASEFPWQITTSTEFVNEVDLQKYTYAIEVSNIYF